MPDVYNTITSAEPALVQRIAQALEVRGADDQQKSMLGSYLAEIKFPANARVIEVGCGCSGQSSTQIWLLRDDGMVQLSC